MAAASAAAAKVSTLLAAGEVKLEPFVAKVDPEKCDGTGACVEVCEYEDAIAVETLTVDGARSPTGSGHTGQLLRLRQLCQRLPQPGR